DENYVAKPPEERELCRRMQIKRMEDSVILKIIDDRSLDPRIVVAVIENSGAGQEINISAAIAIVYERAAGSREHPVQRAAVDPYGRFEGTKFIRPAGILAGSDNRAHCPVLAAVQ